MALLLVVYSFCPYNLAWDLPTAKSAKSSDHVGTCRHAASRTLHIGTLGLLPDMDFELVEEGELKIGATAEQVDPFDIEKPAHDVVISEFYMMRTEVTQRLWRAVMGTNPSHFKGDLRPVEMVSWNDCDAFTEKLNLMKDQLLPPGMENWYFRLPTESEWEYAARGGQKSRGYQYAGSDNIDEVAWYDGNSGKQTHNVGQKKPNELRLYDMSGNVWEWCMDWYSDYPFYGMTNPQGAMSGTSRMIRGGCAGAEGWSCRVARRACFGPDYRYQSFGFRLALVTYVD